MSSHPVVPQPPVLKWYQAYAVVLALVYAALAASMVASALMGMQTPPPHGAHWWVPLLMFAGILPFLAAFVAAPFLPVRPWAWTFHLVLICVGFTSACCLPLCVPMLIQWLKPGTKLYFGRAAA